MSLAIEIDQITKKTWWNDSPEPWKNNSKVLQSNAQRRADIQSQLKRVNRPMSYEELAESNDCSIASIRGLVTPMVNEGLIRRIEIDGRIYIGHD